MSNLQIANEEFLANLNRINLDVYSDQDVPELRDRFKHFSKNISEEVQERLEKEYFSCGPLEDLIDDDKINEIVINHHREIYFEKAGTWFQHTDSFLTELTYFNFIQRLCHESGENLSQKFPFLCTKWKSFRVHISEASITGSHCLSLRRHPDEHWTLGKLLDLDWCGDYELELVQDCIANKKNILVVGATGSGKTSFINACLDFIDVDERCVLLEDADELILPNPLSLKMLTRQSPESELKDIDLSELVKQSLRMRPDRLVLGEVRGAEAKDLLMALATGHKGSIASLHADSAQEAILRLEMLIQLGAPKWSLEAIRRLIQLSIDRVVVVKKKNGIRKLDSIWKLLSVEKYGVILHQES